MTAARRAARAEKRNPQITEPPCRPIRASMRSTTWNCRRGSPAGRLTRTQPQALGRGPCLPAQHPVPRRGRCPHPAISAGPAWTRRLASGQSGRRAARQGSGVSPASTEPPLLPPSMTSVSPAPVRSGPAARDGGCWPGGPGRTSDITTSTSSAASESGAWRGSRKPDSGCPPHACAAGAYAPRARDSGKPGGHGHVMRWVGNRGPFACPRGNYVPTGICRFGVILTR